MSERPWMPLYVNDFRMDTLDLGVDQIGVYLIMLMLMWRREDASLPNDMAWLKRSLQQCAANFHGHTFNRIVPKLLDRYFQLGQDGKWRNKRLTKERQIADKRSANQSQIADKRWSDLRKNKELADANAIPSQSQSQSHKEREIYKEKESRVVRLKEKQMQDAPNLDGKIFIEVDSPEWEAWSKLKRWPQTDSRANGRVKRGWWFRSAWPTSEFNPNSNNCSAPISKAIG